MRKIFQNEDYERGYEDGRNSVLDRLNEANSFKDKNIDISITKKKDFFVIAINFIYIRDNLYLRRNSKKEAEAELENIKNDYKHYLKLDRIVEDDYLFYEHITDSYYNVYLDKNCKRPVRHYDVDELDEYED